MHFRRWLPPTILALSVALSGCTKVSTSDIEVQGRVNPKVDDTALHTYAWLGGASITSEPNGLWNPPAFDINAETKFLIDSELRDRGLSEVTEGAPDLMVSFLILNDVSELQKIEGERASDVPKLNAVGDGALLIEVIDVASARTIFLGAATAKTQSANDNDTMKARLDYAVKHIFAEWKFKAAKAP